MRKIPILTFHSLDASGSVISTSPTRFAKQIGELAERGWQSCTVAQVLAWRRGRGSLPDRAVAITFDDGYRSVHDVALPILRAHRFTATVFVTVGRCTSDNRWPGQASWVPILPMLAWDELEELCEAGWEIGAHGMTHLPLTVLDQGQAAREIETSRKLLGERIRSDVTLFAYPYGAHNACIRDLVRRAYQGACAARLGWARPHSDCYALPRIDGYYLRTWLSPAMLDNPVSSPYIMLRSVGRVLRKRRYWDQIDVHKWPRKA
jgi:peptidoglycan/xylan/chitin deacetylase (PgdA/CDA1 family)